VVDSSQAPLPSGTITAFVPGSSFTLSNRPKGWLAGLQFGYNWQFDRVVAGLEADVSFGDLKDTAEGTFINTYNRNGDNARTLGNAALETKVNALGTLRGRLGYAVAPTFLPYVTGGLAWGVVKNTVTVSGTHYDIGGGLPGTVISSFNNSNSSTDWLFGFAVGGGAEWMIAPRWIVRGEYLYINLSGKSHTLVVPGIAASNTDFDAHIARVALNYKFTP
jgi:outer membrane immunogenic protein